MQQQRVKHICGSCSFKFSREVTSKLSKNCPNCGTGNVYRYKPLNADYFIRMAERNA